MSAQINLYHPRYLKQRDLLTLSPIVIAAMGLYLVLAVTAVLAWREASTRQASAAAVGAQLTALKTQVEAETKAMAARKPSPQMQSEVDSAEAMLQRREEIVRLLESGAVGNSSGFSDHFRGLARQAPEGLWLTGFSAGAGGGDMEIRGSTLNAATVPDYIRRLGGEKAFQGRRFAALTMQRPEPPPAAPIRAPSGAGAVSSAPTLAVPVGPRPIDFVLLPKPADAVEGRP